MSLTRVSTTTSTYNNNIERISPYTIEEFNKLLEDNKPYTTSYFKNIKESKVYTIIPNYLEYYIDIKVINCLKCLSRVNNNVEDIVEHYKVSRKVSIFTRTYFTNYSLEKTPSRL